MGYERHSLSCRSTCSVAVIESNEAKSKIVRKRVILVEAINGPSQGLVETENNVNS